ncbi:beta-propeller fold lactonase family protein [Candidatus Tachikawaea gelatinosa]|uniref:6-phosphogluconolactonase n=1 Tax=Candidatus Tachikawaea gelatinosa TaxID=1410383 RepID=A0A090ARK0_9ENTR|nr:beta-propeller fold lactonase family protein [Candidatus Tachikawaea gelatinosa]BAP58415.1 6-phosphogluconolactonase [Candidatus Tachikawaea gelatinosa]
MKQFFYITSVDSQEIHVFQMKKNGYLTLLQILKEDEQIQPICVNYIKNKMYVGTKPNFYIITYNIRLDGTLEKIEKKIIDSSPTYISIDPINNFLFYCSYNYNCFNIYKLNDISGLLESSIPIKNIKNIQGCHFIKPDLKKLSIFVTSLKKDLIYVYSNKNNCWHISEKIDVKKKSGPRHIAFHPNNNYFYSINELNATIDVFKKTEKISFLKTVKMFDSIKKNQSYWSSDIHITPTGKYLYACDRYFSKISIFSIINNGSDLKFNKNKKTESQPRGFEIDFTGQYLVVAGQLSHHISVYKINQNTGNLDFIYRYKVGKNPIFVKSFFFQK